MSPRGKSAGWRLYSRGKRCSAPCLWLLLFTNTKIRKISETPGDLALLVLKRVLHSRVPGFQLGFGVVEV